MSRPNILFIMTDDHAAHAMSCYGSRINTTPNLDRIAQGGMRFNNCFCTNSICGPSRATILTGTYNHVNGMTHLRLAPRQPPAQLCQALAGRRLPDCHRRQVASRPRTGPLADRL